jgi:flagellar basal body rod protein FlgG
MKKSNMLLFLPAIVFLTICQASDLHAQNISQHLIVQSLEEELKNQEQLQDEIAAVVKEIRTSDEAQRKLFVHMAMILDKVDVLTATAEAIDAALDVTLHNIANFDTPGFKRTRVHIQDGRIVDKPRIWDQGNFIATGNPLDLTIDGKGFFRILQPNGDIAYTRDGSMHLNLDGNIVTSEGNMLDPQIAIPQDQIGITIGSDGTVAVQQSGKSQWQQVGRIELAGFKDPSGLKVLGRNLFIETPSSGQPVVALPGENGSGRILAGYLENSNVKILEEIIQLRKLQSWEKGIQQALTAIHEK